MSRLSSAVRRWLARPPGTSIQSPLSLQLSFLKIDPYIPVADVRFWQQHVPEYNRKSAMGIHSPKFQDYVMGTSAGPVAARSMLTEYELALLFALARYHYKGLGYVVELGPLIGVGTYALARGLTDNPDAGIRKRIYTYDLFLLENMTHFLPGTDGGGTGSVFDRFLKINRDFLDIVTAVPGDFLKMSWTGEPIEILFIDLAKSWELNRHVLVNFFPHLIPGHSIVLQQDYVHVGEPWIALTMEILSEYFERLYFVYGATAAYKLTRPIPTDVLCQDLKALPLIKVDPLFERARTTATPAIAEVLKCCQAAIRIEKGDFAGAAHLVDSVDTNVRDGLSSSQEFNPAIRANLNAVKRWLDRARN